jgi:hypothetical protein
MAAWSPTLEGFRSVFRRPALPLAEVAWRWSFGAAAAVLIALGFIEFLDTLPLSNVDLLLFSTRHPLLISQALAHILRGSGLRLAVACVFLFSSLAVLWIVVASVGRAATLDLLLEYIRKRAGDVRREQNVSAPGALLPAAITDSPPQWRLRSLVGLNFLRAGLALAACTGSVGAMILAGLASSKTHPRPGIVFLLAVAILLLVWLAWSSVSWFLSLASIFVVRQGKDTFGAVSSAVELFRERFGPVMAVGTCFGLTHLIFFIVATSVVTFPLAFAAAVPMGLVLGAWLLLTLVYFAIVDALYVGRLAGYIAILEAPPAPQPLVSQTPLVSTQPSTLNIQLPTAMVDQQELILGDASLADADDPLKSAGVDQDELILGDTATRNSEPSGA